MRPSDCPHTPEDAALVQAFESCALEATRFQHRDHVRVAWVYLRGASFGDAGVRFATNLRRFADAKGAAALYHETMTWAYVALVNERLHACDAADFDAFALANPDLLDHKGGALVARYDRETLDTELARRVFVLPGPRVR